MLARPPAIPASCNEIYLDRRVSDTKFDIMIKNGRLMDGTDNPCYRADLGMVGERIYETGILPALSPKAVVDASGLLVSPGFIDIHSHSDLLYSLPDNAQILSPFVCQGTRTQVIGNCGISPSPVNKDCLSLMKRHLALRIESSV